MAIETGQMASRPHSRTSRRIGQNLPWRKLAKEWTRTENRKRLIRMCTVLQIRTAKSYEKIFNTSCKGGFKLRNPSGFYFFPINNQVYSALHCMDLGLEFLEAWIMTDHRVQTIYNGKEIAIIYGLDTQWINRHGSSVIFSAEYGFNRKPFRDELLKRHSKIKYPPIKRHTKLGVAERKHSTIKWILGRPVLVKENVHPELVLSRAVFLENWFSGSSLLRFFQLVNGYSLSIVGIPARLVPP